MTNILNCERKHILKIFVKVSIYLSGITILIWQVHGTFETFIRNRTSFEVRQDTFNSLVPPTIVYCSRNPKAGDVNTWYANISNKDQFNKDFFWLNEKVSLLMIIDNRSLHNEKEGKLSLGENFDGEGNLLVTVEELMNPQIGLCYAIIPDKNFRLHIEESILFVAVLAPGVEKATVYFTSEEDRYGLLFNDFGRLMPFQVSLDTGFTVGVNLKKMVWNKLSSKGNCKHYTKEKSFMKCMLNNQVKCFKRGNFTCKCIPENNHKTHFKLFPVQWNACRNDEEYKCSTIEMALCYLDEMVTKGCPLPCKTEEYIGQKLYMNRLPPGPNSIMVQIKYSTMNVQIQEEYQVQDIYNFIGTVGGSLGLFIGFSYTGFFGILMDYIIRIQNQYA